MIIEPSSLSNAWEFILLSLCGVQGRDTIGISFLAGFMGTKPYQPLFFNITKRNAIKRNLKLNRANFA